MMALAEDAERRLLGMDEDRSRLCHECEGSGLAVYARSEHAPDCDGTCRGCPVPVPYAEKCHKCGGLGVIG